MNLKDRVKKETAITPYIKDGYSRKMSNSWYAACQRDMKNNRKWYKKETIDKVHARGYLARSISKYGLLNNENNDYITDFDYMFLSPFNNSFTKWIEDIITTDKVLKDYREYFRPIYFSLVKRDRATQVYKYGEEFHEYTADDILDLLEEKEELVLRPSAWISSAKIYQLTYNRDEDLIYVNGKEYTYYQFVKLIKELGDEKVVIGDYEKTFTAEDGQDTRNQIRLYVTNDLPNGDKILEATISVTKGTGYRKAYYTLRVDLDEGTYSYQDRSGEHICKVPGWDNIVKAISDITEALTPLSYFAIDIVVNDKGFTVINFSANPSLPTIAFGDKLNNYLKDLAAVKKEKFKVDSDGKGEEESEKDDEEEDEGDSDTYGTESGGEGSEDDSTSGSRGDRGVDIKSNRRQLAESIAKKAIAKSGRKGIRYYMQKMWLEAVMNDLKGTKLPIQKKIWAWERGFLSFRTYQYGLTNSNYKNFLSDYDYFWLNRINNNYQKWINDKTTFRFTMDPFKDYIPDYYYMISNKLGKTTIKAMQDCPYPELDPSEGIFKILEQEKKLALKASGGTHGDGFYCLAYEDGQYLVNNEAMTKEEIMDLINSQKSFYIITQWINMHHELKEIYPNAVSSIRVMVINRHGYDPKIMQTYIRIGSSKTGFTDNIGYGGICAFIDQETGKLYAPETLVDHVYYPCPIHPDTQTEIEGRVIPCWEEAKKLVIDICQYMPELEYLGFDVTITEDGPQIIEINIHQDLHKVALYPQEVMDFFHDKIEQKKKLYRLK